MTYHQAKAILEARKQYLEARLTAVADLIERVKSITNLPPDADIHAAVVQLASAYLDFLTAMQGELKANHKGVVDEQVELERAAVRSVIIPGVTQ